MNSTSDLLPVSELHKIHYEVCGNPDGEPILFVHGGPGAGYAERDKRFFDFNKQRVVFFDQRSSSRSTPFGTIEENTTPHLVADINILLDHLKIKKVTLFGGSWGTTLSLVYAIQNPERVNRLLLRGIFLANKAASDYFLNGGTEQFYPEVWKRFEDTIPKDNKQSVSEFYLDKMLNGTEKERDFFCYEWAFYEISIFKKNISEEQVNKVLNEISYKSLSILEAYYSANNFFLEENYILNNIKQLDAIPVKIVHGKNDVICPAEYAIELNENLKNSELFIVDGGHSDTEPEIEKKLIELINENNWS